MKTLSAIAALVDKLNDELEEKNDSGKSVDVYMEYGNDTINIKWFNIVVWDSDQCPEDDIEDVEIAVREEMTSIMDYFKAINTKKPNGGKESL